MDTPIELLTQALLGELPEERKRCFEAWLQESEEHRLLWERFRQQGYFENTLSELHAVDAEGAFREFLRNRKRIRIRRVIKYAAVLLPFAFLLGWAARQTFRINETVNLPAEEQIAHGKIKAQLFLSNGTKCDLGENDCLLNEGQVNVVASGGKLQYENKAGELEEEVKYNVLIVPRGGEYTLALSDGTVVNLNSESELKYPVLFTGDTRTVRVSGEAYFEVSKNKEKPFIVKTTKGDVEVLGTKFYISAYATTDVFETSLIEGKVKVHTAYEDMTLYPKDKAVLENGLLTRKQIDDMDTYRWRDGLYCFKNLSFDDVLKQFEIYYDIRFVKENPQIANPKLNGKFRLIDGVDYALRVLQREVGFSFRRDDEANVIYLK